MIGTLALNTFRECFRRPFPYFAGIAVVLVALASRMFLVFAFGGAEVEAVNLAISAVFLAGFLQATFQGTGLIRTELERGTFGLVLTTPVGLQAYVIARFLGLALASLVLCALVGLVVAALFLLFPEAPGFVPLAAGYARALLPVLVLDAAALAASAAAPGIAAPLALLALFLAGTLAGAAPLFPDFALFGLEATATPSWLPLALYCAVYVSIFVLLTLIVLGRKQPLRGQR
jgi:ABC-type transport system involved in multi-copper enzyme maturation permease subunit